VKPATAIAHCRCPTRSSLSRPCPALPRLPLGLTHQDRRDFVRGDRLAITNIRRIGKDGLGRGTPRRAHAPARTCRIIVDFNQTHARSRLDKRHDAGIEQCLPVRRLLRTGGVPIHRLSDGVEDRHIAPFTNLLVSPLNRPFVAPVEGCVQVTEPRTASHLTRQSKCNGFLRMTPLKAVSAPRRRL
jgi:hypothetical protein